MVFEILNTILLVFLLLINYKISKKINIILIKHKPLASLVDDIMGCDKCNNIDKLDKNISSEKSNENLYEDEHYTMHPMFNKNNITNNQQIDTESNNKWVEINISK